MAAPPKKAREKAPPPVVETRVGLLEPLYHDVNQMVETVEAGVDDEVLGALATRLTGLESERAFLEHRANDLKGEIALLRFELKRNEIANNLRWLHREVSRKPAAAAPAVASASAGGGKTNLQAVLEGLLVDPEFCGSVKHCGKIAKGAPPLRPNLEYLFQAVESHATK